MFFVDGYVARGPVTSPFGNASPRVRFATTALEHGAHNVEVVHLGDGTYKSDTGTATLTVN